MSSVPVRASTKKKMSLGRGGDVRLEGIASKSYFCSGKNAEIEVHVTNETKHKVSSIWLFYYYQRVFFSNNLYFNFFFIIHFMFLLL